MQRGGKLSDSKYKWLLTKYGIKFCWCNRPLICETLFHYVIRRITGKQTATSKYSILVITLLLGSFELRPFMLVLRIEILMSSQLLLHSLVIFLHKNQKQ